MREGLVEAGHQVVALAPSDQPLGQVALLLELEHPGIRRHRVECRRALRRHVEQRQMGHLAPMRRRIGIGNRDAHIVADQVDAAEAEFTDELVHVLGHRLLVVAAGGFVRPTRAAQVGDD